MKKLRKTKEEKIAENYFPLDHSNIKLTVEKQYKETDLKSLETIETPEKSKLEKKNKEQKTPGKKRKTPTGKKEKIKFSPPKTELKENGYELIITEKPQAALKIASSLGKTTSRNFNKIPYYEVIRNGKKIIVACAVGHLFTLKQKERNSGTPVFDIEWIPNYLAKKNDFTKKYYDTILKLSKEAGTLTVATDYDVEGEVIGLNIVRFICGQKDANRMKFSTLTESELNKSYENKLPNIDWGQAIAGETRHYLDWFYGINLSRALMDAIKKTGNFRIMSIGRVQGPALNMIVQKENEIKKFKSQPFWEIFIKVTNKKETLELKYVKDIFDKKELEKFKDLIGKTAVASTKKTEQIIPPNPPFNLTNLQTEAYRFYGITPSETLRIAKSLYLSGIISYPRTSSQKLPDSIDYQTILKKLAKEYKVEKLITKSKPVEGEKSDPAHPSIYPTGNSQILAGRDEKIYDLIVKRFLALFCDSAIIDKKTVRAEVTSEKNKLSEFERIEKKVINPKNLIFTANGSSIRKKAWMEIYPSGIKENEIPDINGEVKIIDSRIEEKQTQPPKRYSPASIVSELEKRNLGTKATRAAILETLYDRGYIKEKSIEATSLGISLISTLEKYSPIIIDEELTRNFEKEMEDIQETKKDMEKKEEKIISEAKNAIIKISKDFQKNEEKIGQELLQANNKLIEQERETNKLTICPACKKGSLAITYSKKNKRFFIACNAYPECKTTYSLPPNSIIKKTGKFCEKCNFPTLMSLKRGRKPWIFCFNKDCESNKERLEKYRKEHPI